MTPPEVEPARLRAILLDDEDALVRAGSRLLERIGCEVRAFVSPREALDALEGAPAEVDVFFTDLSMPELSGHEVVAHIARVRGDLPIVVCTGSARGDVDMPSIANPLRWLSKPFSRDALVALIADLRSSR